MTAFEPGDRVRDSRWRGAHPSPLVAFRCPECGGVKYAPRAPICQGTNAGRHGDVEMVLPESAEEAAGLEETPGLVVW